MTLKLLIVPVLLSGLCIPDIAPNPRNRSALDLAPGLDQTAIAMRAEVVELLLHEDHAEVRAVFDLEHTGTEPESLEVGFPTEAKPLERGIDQGLDYTDTFDSGGGGSIYRFTAEVDGVAVKAERKKVQKDDPRKVHRHWVCWQMEFAPGQKRRVAVSYEVETKDAMYLKPHSPLQPRELFYVLKTGRGWKDVIGSARIVLRIAPGLDLDLGHIEETSPPPTSKTDDAWEWLFENFEPDEDIRVRYRVHRDAAHAVPRIRAELRKQPDDPVLLLDLAENLAVLDEHAEAAPLFARIADWGTRRTGAPGPDAPGRYWKLPKTVFTRIYYRPATFLAASSYTAAGQPELARTYRDRALKTLADRIDSLRRSIDGGHGRSGDQKMLAQLIAYRDQLRAIE